MKTVVIAGLALALTFIAGFVVGAVVDRLVMWHRGPGGMPPPMAGHVMMARLAHQLDLTDPQRAQIETILERRHARMRQLMEAARPQIDQEIAQTNAEIERVLTPEQRRKFQDLKIRLGPRMHHEGGRRTEPTR